MKYIFAAALMALTVGWFGPLLDQIDESARINEAQKEAQRVARFEKAARAMCGSENAAFVLLDDGAIQCKTKRGHLTRVVSMEAIK